MAEVKERPAIQLIPAGCLGVKLKADKPAHVASRATMTPVEISPGGQILCQWEMSSYNGQTVAELWFYSEELVLVFDVQTIVKQD